MGNFVEQRNLGEVFSSPVDVRLTPYDVVVPDLFFLRTERFHLFDQWALSGAPDLIVEVRSPSTRSRDLTTKLHLYARTGVQEYWIVDPDTSTVTVYTLSASGAYELLPAHGGKVRSNVLSGFELDAHDLVKGLD
jgi:Uma2 family endonuclease